MGLPAGDTGWLPSLLARIPSDAEVLPSSMSGPHLLGEHATERQVAAVPNRVSPRFLRATRRAQQSLPAIDENAVVFCSLSDRIVSTRAIGDRVSSERIVLYDGGHELFSSRSREAHVNTVLRAIEDGSDGIE